MTNKKLKKRKILVILRYLIIVSIFLSIGYFFSCNSIGNGNDKWEKTFSKGNFNIANSIIQTSDDGYAFAGYTSNDSTGNDFWVTKLDKDGKIIWSDTYGGSDDEEAKSLIQTSDGGYAVAGFKQNKETGNNSFWILKLDKEGKIIWSRMWGGLKADEANSIIQTTDGNYVVAGYTESKGAGKKDFLIIKLNKTGNFIWEKTFGKSGDDEAKSVINTKDGGIAVAGYTTIEEHLKNFWIIKLDVSGNKEWETNYHVYGDDEANSIIQTNSGEYIVAGYSERNKNLKSGIDFCILKLDKNGNKLWSKTYSKLTVNKARSVVETGTGNYVIAGSIHEDLNNQKIWILQIDKKGKKVWEHVYGGGFFTEANSLISTSDNGYAIAGKKMPEPDNPYRGIVDAWILKLDEKGK